jgi:formylglycine-generating enzyme required for sulfatase activity
MCSFIERSDAPLLEGNIKMRTFTSLLRFNSMLFQRFLMILLLLLFVTFSAYAAKPNLVLLPIDVTEQDSELEAEYGAALQEGLQNRYTVFYGASVEKELEKEYSKVDCDAETCNQNIAIAFNGELIADGAVKRIGGGYLLKLVVTNVLTNQVVETRTQPCEGCNQFAVMRNLTLMGAGEKSGESNKSGLQINHSSSASNSSAAKNGQRAILIFDSQPTGASILINGKASGKTPYQGLSHSINETLNIELSHANYEKASLTLQLQQAITQLEPIQLKLGMGSILIASAPYVKGAHVYIDGQKKGEAPLSLILAAGEHNVQIKTAKQETEIKTIKVVMGNNDPFTLSFGMQAGDVHITKTEGADFEFVGIPAGSFRMGSNDNDSEKPVHTVNVPAFQMMTTEVTQGQWHAITGNNPAKFKSCGGRVVNNSCPVETVSWNDVQGFIKKLNQKTGKVYRLPSEAEWEYAARAGSITKYSWGDDIDCSKARYGYYSDECGKKESTDPVKSFQPNSFGLYDMNGNVWEWTQDCWNTSYKGAPSDGSLWMEGDCERAVVRGGSWNDNPTYLRSANRNRFGRASRNTSFGFRLIQGQ